MKKIITSIDSNHNEYVDISVTELHKAGYEIIEIKRISKMKFLIFGEDVTEITYTLEKTAM